MELKTLLFYLGNTRRRFTKHLWVIICLPVRL